MTSEQAKAEDDRAYKAVLAAKRGDRAAFDALGGDEAAWQAAMKHWAPKSN